MKVLSVIKAFEGKPINAVGAAWAGCILNNELIRSPEIDKLGVMTNVEDCEYFDPRIRVHKITTNPRKDNKEIIEKAIDIYNEYGYDIIHLHVGSLGIIKWIAELVPDNVNLVYTLHTPTMLGRSSVVYGPYGKLMNNKKNLKIVGPSNYMQKVWHEFTGDYSDIGNLYTAYNGISNSFRTVPLVPVSNRNGMAIMCGRITPMKRVYNALQVVKEYKIPTIYIGDNFEIKNSKPDDYYDMCKDILSNCSNIAWIKHLDNYEVLKLMSESSCLITMSDQESFGLTVAEAVSVGTPVIYSTGGAIEEVLGYDNVGIRLEFVPKTTWHTRGKLILDAFSKIVSDKVIFDPNKLRNYVADRYTLPRMANRYIEIYKEFNK